jgi:hypothetical protein
MKKYKKLKAERCFYPPAFTLARRSAGPGFFLFGFIFRHPELVEGFVWLGLLFYLFA